MDANNNMKKTMEQLIKIQSELKAPKNQYNAFGKYKYRSQEDILEALKPLLAKYKCTLTISDEIKEVGGLVFVEATAKFSDGKQTIEVTAQAGITERKGMDLSQSFGSSSSYARKYALNGLFLIDDTKDADATNTHGNELRNISKLISECNDESALNSLWKKCSESEQVKFREEFSKRKQEILG